MEFFKPQLTPLPDGRGKHVLITGATGVVGRGAVESFRAAGWTKITAVSRRRPTFDLQGINFLPLDLLDREACAKAVAALPDLTHVAYTAVLEKPGEMFDGWSDPEQIRKNGEMLKNTLDPVLASCPDFEHISFMQGGKAYGFHKRMITTEAFPQKEREPRVVHENFYWVQEDHVRAAKAAGAGRRTWSWTAWRPPMITGHSIGSNMSTLDALGAYAALCAEKGEPMYFGGGEQAIMTAVDTRILGRAMCWATSAPGARDQHFNIYNGDAFLVENIFKKVAELYNVPYGGFKPFALEDEVLSESSRAAWERLSKRHGLLAGPRALARPELLPAPGHVASQIREDAAEEHPLRLALDVGGQARQAGFADCIDSEDMFVECIQEMQRTKVLPPLRQGVPAKL